MIEYLKAQSRTNEVIVNNEISADEVRRLSASDERWATNRSKSISKRNIKKGDIYQFEFGKNYSPEMSYEHRGLVIGVKGKLLYVLPIFSYIASKMTDVYHPIDAPTSKSDLYLLKQAEFPFIRHDSVLKLNDFRTVSVNRILYSQPGRIDTSSDTYKRIEELALQKCFPDFFYRYSCLLQEVSNLSSKLKELEAQQNKEAVPKP